MSIFDEINATVPEPGGTVVTGPWWCQENECFEVSDEAMLSKDEKFVVWVCDDGHKNKKEWNIG